MPAGCSAFPGECTGRASGERGGASGRVQEGGASGGWGRGPQAGGAGPRGGWAGTSGGWGGAWSAGTWGGGPAPHTQLALLRHQAPSRGDVSRVTPKAPSGLRSEVNRADSTVQSLLGWKPTALSPLPHALRLPDPSVPGSGANEFKI